MMNMLKRISSTLCVFLISMVATSAFAEILVDEGFKTGSETGYYSTTDKTSLANSLTPTYTQSTGFPTNKWQSNSGVFVSRTSGLAFPSSFSGKMNAQGAGAIGFRGESSAVNWNASSGVAQSDLYRNQHRKIVPLNGSVGAKRYFRALMYADSTALGQLSPDTKTTWLSWKNGYTLGIATLPSNYSGTSSIMDCPRYMHFSLYRNTAANKYEMAFTVRGNASGEVAKRVTLCDVTAGHTYLVVAEITLADGPEQLRAFAYDCTTDAGLDPNNLPWVDASSESTYTLIDDTDNLSLFLGGQYKTTGTLMFDEIRIATELNEVMPVSDSYVTVGVASVANLTTTSAELSATVGMKGVASATPSVAWGTAADALVNSATLDPIAEAGSVTKSLTGLDPMTTYYYQWTVTASGADPATSSVASFKTKGEVVFGDVTAGGLPSEGGVWASVDVAETGIGATTVTCWCGETAESMTAIGTWQNVQAGDTLVATNSAAAWGKTYLFKFTSSFEYGNQTYESETPSASRQAAATDHLKTTASGNWLDGANWSLGTPPSDVLSATISNVTDMASLYLQDTDAVVKSLTVKMGKATVDLRGHSSMTIGSITFGDKNIQNSDSGEFVTTGGVVTVNGNVAPAYQARTSYNKLVINGTKMTINGSLSTETAHDSGGNNSVHVGRDAVLVITNGITLTRSGTMVVDGGTVTNKAYLNVAQNARSGTLTLQNGAVFRQHWAKSCGIGGKGEGAMNVLSGSTFDASGADFYVGREGDTPSGNSSLTVSNATFKVKTFASPRYTNFTMAYTTSIIGADAVFRASDSVTLGPVTQQAGTYRASGTTQMTVDGATVSVANALNVGGGDNDRGMNYLTVSGPTVRMELGTLNCRTNATVKFVVPERGFENAAIISATNRISLAEGMPPIKIDATACKGCGWVSLFEAEKGISNLTEENLASRVAMVEKEGHMTVGDRPYEFRLVVDGSGATPIVKALKFKVSGGGFTIIVR